MRTMRQRWVGVVGVVAAMATTMGCGGEATDTPRADAGAAVDEATDTAQIDAGVDADATGAEATPAEDAHLPEAATPPPPPYDPRALPGGSVEGNAGHGWDTCHSRTPGCVKIQEEADAGRVAEGKSFVRFSSGSCEHTFSRANNPSDAQLYFFLPEARVTTAATSLHFDVTSLTRTPSEGTLAFYLTDTLCESSVVLRSIPLADLALDDTWQTRCVTIPPAKIEAIGLAVTGTSYEIGVDALRFGTGCP